jgi:hypothetical protein
MCRDQVVETMIDFCHLMSEEIPLTISATIGTSICQAPPHADHQVGSRATSSLRPLAAPSRELANQPREIALTAMKQENLLRWNAGEARNDLDRPKLVVGHLCDENLVQYLEVM